MKSRPNNFRTAMPPIIFAAVLSLPFFAASKISL
jgi:hypothetical protein